MSGSKSKDYTFTLLAKILEVQIRLKVDKRISRMLSARKMRGLKFFLIKLYCAKCLINFLLGALTHTHVFFCQIMEYKIRL